MPLKTWTHIDGIEATLIEKADLGQTISATNEALQSPKRRRHDLWRDEIRGVVGVASTRATRVFR